MDNREWEALQDEKRHRLTYYGFKPEVKYGKQGFCGSCHKNFVMKTALTDKFNYDGKTVWTGECPFCRNAFRIVDKELNTEPELVVPTEESFLANGRRLSSFNWALQTLLGLRKFYKNEFRCIFLFDGDFLSDDGEESLKHFYPHERPYYSCIIALMIKTILENPLLAKYWFKTTTEIKEEIGTKAAAKTKFYAQVRVLLGAVKAFEDANWENFFGAQATLKAHEDPSFRVLVKGGEDLKAWLKLHKSEVDAFKTTIMPVDYEGDQLVDADDGLEAEIDANDAELVREEEAEAEAMTTELANDLDSLEYGVSKEYDV